MTEPLIVKLRMVKKAIWEIQQKIRITKVEDLRKK